MISQAKVKRLLAVIVILALVISIAPSLVSTSLAVAQDGEGGKGVPDPAAVYCEQLGYQYDIREDEEGNQYGVCIFPDSSECDAWDFFRGKCGKEYSYCAKQGYDIETERVDEGSYYTECAVCVSRRGVEEIRIPMLELMEKNGEALLGTESYGIGNEDTGQGCVECEASNGEGSSKDLPSVFDWRDVGGHTYIGPIHAQGTCGSCYAFGAAASAEGTYNWATGNYDGNCADFSESFIMWCLGRLPAYSSHFFGCGGADWDYAELEALTVEGICDESDFPYTVTDPGSCTHWGDPTTVFSSWGRIPCSDVEAIKTAIMTYGVVDAAVDVGPIGSDFRNYSGGIYTDSNTTCPSTPCYYTYTNHAISLVGWGYDGTYGDYWILRNSWGETWGESGYMRIAVTSARVACEATYFVYTELVPDIWVDPTGGFNVTLPPGGTWSDTLTIGNDGGVALTYDITDVETTGVLVSREPVELPPPKGVVSEEGDRQDVAPGAGSGGATAPPTEERLALGDVQFSYDVETPSGDTQCLGVEFDGDNFYITGGNSTLDPNKVHVFDRDGNYLSSFDQTSAAGWGWRDLAWDGSYLYGSDSSDVIQFTTGGTVIGSFPGPGISVVRALAYDPATDHFWTADFGSSIYEFDRSGNVINTFSNSYGIYGMAWDDVSPGGPWLWVFAQEGLPEVTFYQFDPVNGVYTGVSFTSWSGVAGGASFTTDWNPAFGILVGLNQATPDSIVGHEISSALPDASWLDESPTSGSVAPANSVPITVSIDTAGLAVGDYSADIIISNNDPDENPTIVPVNLSVATAVTLEFGDAPDPSYPSLLISDGARHNQTDTEILGLVSTPDSKDYEPDAKVTDLDLFDDGLLTFGIMEGNPAETISFEITDLSMSPSSDLRANILIDLNRDGDWNDAGEHVVVNQPITTTTAGVEEQVVVSTPFSTKGATPGATWLRITLTRSDITFPWDGTMAFNGSVPFEYGETEDYVIGIEAMPDLEITEKFEEWVVEGDSYNISYTVKNIGGATAGASTVRVDIDDGQVALVAVPALDPGESWPDTRGPYTLSGDTDTILVVADKDNVVVESDETNNELQNVWGEYVITGVTGEVACDILPNTTVEAYKGAVLKASTTSDVSGDYTLSLPELGDYDVVASKTGYKNETQQITITGTGVNTLDFRGNYGLIPETGDMSYFLRCMNLYLEDWGECNIDMPKFLAVMNAYLSVW